jgi:ribosomal protein L23
MIDHKKVEEVAKALVRAFGQDPDEVTTIQTAEGTKKIPRWHIERAEAVRHVTAWSVLNGR